MSSSGSSSGNPFATPIPDPPLASAIAKVTIKAHVPVVLDMNESNFQQWHTFFELKFKKFGLTNHIDGTLDAILMHPRCHKSDVLPTLISFHAFVHIQFRCDI
jgi:hypothetical protein